HTHLLGAVLPDGDRLVPAHAQAAIAPHAGRLAGLDVDRLVLLRLDEQLLAPLLVLEPNLVEVRGRPPLRAAALDPALGLVGREVVGGHVVGVVDAAGDDGPVGVPLQEVDDHLLADARDVHRPPLRARPGLRHANPAGASLVRHAVAVPVELHHHAAVVVGVDLVAARSHDDGR